MAPLHDVNGLYTIAPQSILRRDAAASLKPNSTSVFAHPLQTLSDGLTASEWTSSLSDAMPSLSQPVSFALTLPQVNLKVNSSAAWNIWGLRWAHTPSLKLPDHLYRHLIYPFKLLCVLSALMLSPPCSHFQQNSVSPLCHRHTTHARSQQRLPRILPRHSRLLHRRPHKINHARPERGWRNAHGVPCSLRSPHSEG